MNEAAAASWSWGFLDAFSTRGVAAPAAPSWDGVDALRDLAFRAAKTHSSELDALLSVWNKDLEAIGGDPAFRDWGQFRPLRLSREEDWSDWLAHLIVESEHGFLARALAGRAGQRAVGIEREVSTAEGFRADLVVQWEGGHHSHVEIKVGDLAFEKTFGTADALRLRYPGAASWSDHILIPDWHRDVWEATPRPPQSVDIAPFTWSDLAVDLRRALLHGEERVDWRVWGAAFLGAIEQTLLGLPARSHENTRGPSSRHALLASNHLQILRKARE